MQKVKKICPGGLVSVKQQREWNVEWLSERRVIDWNGLGIMRMNKHDFVKRVYEARGYIRGRPPEKWISGVNEYWRKRENWQVGIGIY